MSEARNGPGLGFLPGYLSVPHSRAVKMKAEEIKELHREFSNLKTQCVALLLCTISVVELGRKMLVRK